MDDKLIQVCLVLIAKMEEKKMMIKVLVIAMFRYVNEEYTPANDAYVGLASPGDAGSWQRECKVTFVKSIWS